MRAQIDKHIFFWKLTKVCAEANDMICTRCADSYPRQLGYATWSFTEYYSSCFYYTIIFSQFCRSRHFCRYNWCVCCWRYSAFIQFINIFKLFSLHLYWPVDRPTTEIKEYIVTVHTQSVNDDEEELDYKIYNFVLWAYRSLTATRAQVLAHALLGPEISAAPHIPTLNNAVTGTARHFFALGITTTTLSLVR